MDTGVMDQTTINQCDLVVYDSDIDLYLAEYLEEIGSPEPQKLLSTQWAAGMQYICQNTFKRDNTSLLALERGCPVANDYNPAAVLALVEKYIYLCNRYNQRVCVEHFSMLSGIPLQTLYRWRDDKRKLYVVDNKGPIKGVRVTISRSDIFETLINSTITSADDIMLSRSGVNSIAYKNGVIERYGTGAGRASDTADFADMALQLGISDQLGLPGD